MLIPNGVDFALIKESSPAAMMGVTVLILNEDDISYIPPRVWEGLQPDLVLWNSVSVSPIETWYGVDSTDQINLISDGFGIELGLP